MELRHLRYFKAVAELLNFSRASERLRVAQPSLSRQIRALEHEIGTELFRRDGGVTLTDAGRVFYAHTCKILAQVDIAVDSARETTSGSVGELIICNDWRVAAEFLPGIIAEFHRRFPRVEVTLLDLKFHDQLAAIRSHRAHLGFVMKTLLGRLEELETMLVLRTRLIVMLPLHHPLAGRRGPIRLAELADETWIGYEEKETPGYRAFLTQLCRLSGFTPKLGKSAATAEGIAGRVASGYGVALTLESSAPHRNALIKVIPLDAEPLELCAVWHRRESSSLLQGFLDIVRAHAAAAKP
jgi:LysR family transcriptional regulator, benzoate and cis,cis-muconate-responsive activator of ben and cat genes